MELAEDRHYPGPQPWREKGVWRHGRTDSRGRAPLAKLEFMLLHAVQVSACGIRPSTAAPMRRCMPIAQRRATPNFT